MAVIGWASLRNLFFKSAGSERVDPDPAALVFPADSALAATQSSPPQQQQFHFVETLRALGHAIEAKDAYTCGHSDRVGLLAAALARRLGHSDAEISTYRAAGLLHDIGKIGVSEGTLRKTGRLTEEEFCRIKQHPEIGYNLLREIHIMQDVLPGVLHHHERWDGGGYPHGLRGENIPLMARCLALADTFDAMSSTRPYRRALPRPSVLEEIRRSAGSQFDVTLVEIFCSLDLSSFDLMLCKAGQLAA